MFKNNLALVKEMDPVIGGMIELEFQRQNRNIELIASENIVSEAVMAAMGVFVIRRTREVYSARWHGKLATCVIYTVIFLHIVWYSIPTGISAALAWCAIGTILMSLVLYTVQNIRKLRR